MLIHPTPLNLRIAIKVRNVVGSEKCRADVSDEPTNGVYSEDIQGVVDSHYELEFGGVVGESSPQDSVDYCGPGGNITCEVLGALNFVFHSIAIVINLPEPGVIATRPATTPEQKPTVDHLPSSL